MGIVLIFLGLFLWLALAFNGTVGNTFVNYLFFISAALMVIAGFFSMNKTKWKITRNICTASLITYLPMIWQRFNFKYDVDWVGFKFDVIVVIVLLIFIIKNLTNHSSGRKKHADLAPL
ncbi:MAG: hypothetical protein DRQ48_02095 [Gammaproteobacteria bacterium]|nr:MAG: hypothetical protein DRQ58_03435 [Gammaproteobacteria bacterium]RKZ71888.1 MAG: hypothetical protein DRQ48_02095 [Gammaproteobacteria bacterium]